MGSSLLEKVVIGAGVITLSVLIILVGALGGAIVGAFSGWAVEHTFLQEFVIGGTRIMFGFQIFPEQLPAIGAVFGFIGSFFKSTLTNKSD